MYCMFPYKFLILCSATRGACLHHCVPRTQPYELEAALTCTPCVHVPLPHSIAEALNRKLLEVILAQTYPQANILSHPDVLQLPLGEPGSLLPQVGGARKMLAWPCGAELPLLVQSVGMEGELLCVLQHFFMQARVLAPHLLRGGMQTCDGVSVSLLLTVGSARGAKV